MSKTIKKKYLLIFIVLITSFVIIDFSIFYNKINNFNHNKESNKNLVVLTGGNFRIKQTIKLFMLKDEMKFNLLISGAGKGFNKKTLLKLFPHKKNFLKTINCCINIENKSKDTFSNAIETLNWSYQNNLKSITLITSDYHMPRALMVFKSLLVDIKIIPFALHDKVDKNVLILEYFKFLLTKFRLIFMFI